MTNGFFAGGLARGFAAGAEISRRQGESAFARSSALRKMGLEQQKIDILKEQASRKKSKEERGILKDQRLTMITDIDAIEGQLAALGKENPAQARMALNRILNGIDGRPETSIKGRQDTLDTVSAGLGVSSRNLTNFFMRAAGLGKTDAQRIEDAKIAGAAAGTKDVAREEAGGKPVQTANMRNFITPAGEKGIVNLNDPKAMGELPEGSTLFSVQAQPKSAADLGTPTSKDVQAARSKIATGTANINDLSDVLSRFEATKGAAGIRGQIAEVGAGLLGQLPVIGEAVGDAFSKSVAGATRQRVTDVRTRARFMVSRLLSTITAETSGRYTDRERAIAEEALKTLTPTSAFPEIRAATIVAMESEIFATERAKALIDPKLSPYFDRNKLGDQAAKLEALGFTKEEAVEIVLRLHRELQAMTGG